jgi:hypothetical protein
VFYTEEQRSFLAGHVWAVLRDRTKGRLTAITPEKVVSHD